MNHSPTILAPGFHKVLSNKFCPTETFLRGAKNLFKERISGKQTFNSSSHPEVFCNKSFLEKFAKLNWKSFTFECTFNLRKRLYTRCFLEEFEKFF